MRDFENKNNKRFGMILGLFAFSFLMTMSIILAMNNAKNNSQDVRSGAEETSEELVIPTTQELINIQNTPTEALEPTLIPTIEATPTPEPLLSNYSVEFRDQLYTDLKWPISCESAFKNTSLINNPDYSGIEQYQIAPNKTLIQVICSSGANQNSQFFYIYDQSTNPPTTYLQKFKRISATDAANPIMNEEVSEIPGLATYDSTTQELKIHRKYRAFGDCGSLEKYVLEENSLVLVELKHQIDCDDVSIDPEQWPVVYQR